MASLTRTRAEHESRINEERKRAERGKQLVVLMLHHLTQAGYTGSVETLAAESGVTLNQFEVADNVELISVLQEWEDFYELRFARKPKIVKKLSKYSSEVDPHGAGMADGKKGCGGGGAAAARARRASSMAQLGSGGDGGSSGGGADDGSNSARGVAAAGGRRTRPQPSGAVGRENGAQGQRSDPGGEGSPTDPSGLVISGHVAGKGREESDEAPGPWEHRIKKAGLPPAMAANAELRELAGWLQRDMIQTNPNVRWDAIAELDGVKRVLKESLVMPLRYPEYFTGARTAPRIHPPAYHSFGRALDGHTTPRVEPGARARAFGSRGPRGRDMTLPPHLTRLLASPPLRSVPSPPRPPGLLQPWKGVLLYGPPGTGKTLLAKAVATECNTTFFNISASSIVSKWRGDSEKLVRVLFELARHHAPSTIFVDEIDALMSARGDSGEHEGSRRMKTELLVQMDGLLACDAQVFLLAATNLPWELDMALLRRLEKRVLVPFPTTIARATILKRALPVDRLEAVASLDVIAQRTEGYSGSDLVLVAKEAAMRPLRRLLAKLDLDAPRQGAKAPQPGLVDAADLDAALAATKPTVHTYAERYNQWEAEFGSV